MIQQISGNILSTRVREISLLIEKHVGRLNISIYVYSGCGEGVRASE